MRQLVLAVLGYFVLQIVAPHLWDRFMSKAPPWALSLATFVAALACIAFLALSKPVYTRLTNPSNFPASSTLLFALVVAAVAVAAWWQFVLPIRTRLFAQTTEGTVTATPPVSAQPTPQPLTSEQFAAFDKKFDHVIDALIQNPSVDTSAKVPILRDQYDELSKKKNELSDQERENFDKKGLTLESLEEARKQHLKKEEINEQQRKIAQKQKQIDRQAAEKRAQEEHDQREKKFAAPYISIVDQAIADLYDMLRKISSEPIFHDFTGARPSIDGSAMLNDGKFLGGQNLMRVGSHKEWEFHLSIAVPPVGGFPHKHLGFGIQAGNTIVGITNEYQPATGNTGRLQISCRTGEKELYRETCPLSEYQKPIDLALRQLIQSCYNECPLKPNPTPPSLTPHTEASRP